MAEEVFTPYHKYPAALDAPKVPDASSLTPSAVWGFLNHLAEMMKAMQTAMRAMPNGGMRLFSQSLDPASVAANTVAEQTFTVTGLKVGDLVIVNPPGLTAGLGVCGARVSALNTLAIRLNNNTGVAIDEAAGTWQIFAMG